MKLLFVHDVKAFEFNGEYYARSYGYNIFFERYLNVFDSITVCCRVIHALESPEGMIDKSTGSNVTFENRIRNFKGPDVFLDKKIKKILIQNIKNADAVIVRLDSFLGLLQHILSFHLLFCLFLIHLFRTHIDTLNLFFLKVLEYTLMNYHFLLK